MDCMLLELCESISNKVFTCSPNLVDFLPSMEDLASTLSFLQAFPMITSVLWDESHALLMLYLSVPLQGYGVYLGHGLIWL